MSLPSAEPTLYDVDDSGRPTLFGLEDSGGHVSFPFQPHGSERNGDYGELVSRVELSGRGCVTAVVEVHGHRSPALPQPYLLASVALDEGPLLRSVLVDSYGARIGDRVQAVTVATAHPDGEVAELRFTVVADGEPS